MSKLEGKIAVIIGGNSGLSFLTELAQAADAARDESQSCGSKKRKAKQ